MEEISAAAQVAMEEASLAAVAMAVAAAVAVAVTAAEDVTAVVVTVRVAVVMAEEVVLVVTRNFRGTFALLRPCPILRRSRAGRVRAGVAHAQAVGLPAAETVCETMQA